MESKRYCRWFEVCPLKRFYEKGILDKEWIECYCLKDYLSCKRYRMESKGLYHPDNMLPDGSIDKALI